MTKADKYHTRQGAWHQLSNGKNGSRQFRLKGDTMAAGKSRYGHKLSGQAGIIDRCIELGRFTAYDAGVAAGVRAGHEKQRVNQHIRALKAKGFDVQADMAGRLYIANDTISNESHDLLIRNEQAKAEASEQAKVKHVRRQAAIKGQMTRLKKKAK